MSIEAHARDEADQLDLQSSRRTAKKLSSSAVPYLLSTADASVIVLSSILSGFGYQLAVGNGIPDILPYFAVGLFASFIHILRLSGAGYYDFPASTKPRVEITEILVCWFTTGLLLAFLAFLLKIGVEYSRGAFVIFYFVAPVGLLAVRKATKTALASAVSRGTVSRRDIVLIGDVRELAAIEPKDTLAFFGSSDVTRFNLSPGADVEARNAVDSKVLDLVAEFVRLNDFKEIILAMPWGDAERMEFVRKRLKALPVAVRLLPDLRVRSLTNFASSARQRILAIELQRAPLSTAERVVKRGMDLVIATIALILLAPLMALTAIAIKLDSPGPVIFRQLRKGFNGKQFMMLKFRTMGVLENGPSVVQATRDDPRVTPVGRLLRSASIDELPQLINVLRGEMSLIGPRPHALAHDAYFEQLVGVYAFRHHVKPGITGWAQCNGARGATPTIEQIAERVKLDLWYINNWSLWLDIQILVKTFFVVLRRRNAY